MAEIKSNLLVLGGSGAIGQRVIEYAVARGQQVTVIVRDKASVAQHKSIKVIEGNVLDEVILTQAIRGQDTVISCLGIKRKNGKNPWSALVSPKDFTEQVTSKVLKIMGKNQVERFIAVSSAGAADSKKNGSFAMNCLIQLSNVKFSIADLTNMEQVMQQSQLDTLAVRPVGLTDSQEPQQAGIVDSYGLSSTISRAEVAKWLLDAAARQDRFSQPAELIATN
ncbi:NAD(P)H-binding protein [Shewanella sp. KX20019]|uniref:NAD(P)-dependent oxidoreductase n=1 Tax=Shewanella sp. KX20019 TaxID=2803864 RepID=UPI001925A8B2|nr:NAD(P)H-binding protein [Shewanella sp. KX20019]QQX81040.1 NAD(P)H-binding protein [Shewanella sp. KX20019]